MKPILTLLLLAVSCVSPSAPRATDWAPQSSDPESSEREVAETAPSGALAQGSTVRPTLLREISWLVGTWRLERSRGMVEEVWIPAAGGAMFGIGRTITGGRLTSFEYLRIEERADRLVLVAQPRGRVETEFEIVEISDAHVEFENPAHDFPTWIRYERTGDDGLTAVIGGDAQEIRFSYVRSR